MKIELKIVEEKDSNAWDKMVELSSHGTLFHKWKWLKIMEKYSNCKLYPMMAYMADLIVGIYPIFLTRKNSINMAFSPPPGYLLYLGPLILDEKLKQDKKENVFIELQQKMDKFLFKELNCKYVRIDTSPGLYDCRPFRWSGYRVTPQYTYRMNLNQGVDSIWENFDRKLRVGINRSIKDGIMIEDGNENDLKFIHESLSKRYKEQGLKLIRGEEYLLDLYKEFHDNIKIFVANYKGEKIAGIISPLYKDFMYLWIGSIKTDLKGLSPNDLVQWKAITWACNNGVKYFEYMSSSDIQRFRSSRSKYNSAPIIWFTSVKYSSYIYRLFGETFKFLTSFGKEN